MSIVDIEGRKIGDGSLCYIIIEIGSNYNGDLCTAKKMIDQIKDSGADAVKFQIFKENTLYPAHAGTVDYLKNNIEINELVKKAMVPDNYHKELHDYCKNISLTYICTPTDEAVADYLDSIGMAAFKISSYALTHFSLLKHVARKGKPIILSTGSCYMHEVAEAVKIIREEGNNQIILMQCVAQYPAQIEYTNLKVINTLKQCFNLPSGMSDHSKDPFIVPYASVARGANVIEKHFTLDRNQEGPDHSFAIEPDELKNMVKGIREVEKAIGTSEKYVTPVEDELRRWAQRSVFTMENICKDDIISKENIAALRPGKKKAGIPARFYELVLGCHVNKNVSKGEALQWNDILQK